MTGHHTPRDSRDVPQMHKRSQHHDYHGRGIYLITLCTEGRLPLLGRLVGNSLGEAAVEPTALGREVLRCWEQIPEIQRRLAERQTARTGRPCERDITLLDRQLMPDHFHGIIFVRKEMDIALGDVIRGFMVGCTKAYNGISPLLPPQICGEPNPLAPPAGFPPPLGSFPPSSAGFPPSSGSFPPSSAGFPPSSESFPPPPAGFPPSSGSFPPPPAGFPSSSGSFPPPVGCGAYSRPLPSAVASSRPSPLRPLWQKGYHDRLLTHEGQLQNMIDYVRDNPRRLMLRRQHRDLFLVQRNVCFRNWRFSAIGQVRLLDAPLVAVHVRRYFSEQQRRDYMNACILAARNGAVLVSPFISEDEKRVRAEAFREGLSCIQLCAEPFSDCHKPPGELIEYCDGRLLMLTLATGTAQERRITRDECSALNALAESMARPCPDNLYTPILCKSVKQPLRAAAPD